WRHVAFIEQDKPLKVEDEEGGLRWLMSSDVCKHCTHAACLDVCPTGSLFRTEFGTVVVQEDICNGCGYCVPACPFGVLDKRHLPRAPGDEPLALPVLGKKEDGRVWKCTLCYDRLKGGHEPACAKACPTKSIQFGPVDELRRRRTRLSRRSRVTTEMQSYYGRPIVKEPVWQPEIPFYFFFGGIAGASAVLHLGARLTGNRTLARRTLFIGAAADVVGPALLISDLGRPERFLNMLRVFKVTSPMSVGSWTLFISGGASNTAAVLELLGKLKSVKVAAEIVSAAAGPPLTTYTGTLIADTAIPVWHEGRHELPWLFGASALASAGAAACLFLDADDAGPARRIAIGGAVAELTLSEVLEKRLGETGEVSKHEAAGTSG